MYNGRVDLKMGGGWELMPPKYSTSVFQNWHNIFFYISMLVVSVIIAMRE